MPPLPNLRIKLPLLPTILALATTLVILCIGAAVRLWCSTCSCSSGKRMSFDPARVQKLYGSNVYGLSKSYVSGLYGS